MVVAPPPVPFRLAGDRLARARGLFNRRDEILWFGFEAAFEGEAAVIRIGRLQAGLQGGGGTGAINGGVIAAGFDAAAVLCGLGHYDTDTVVTVDLSVQFLALAQPGPEVAWRAWASRTTRSLAFVQAVLGPPGVAFATATAVVKPA